jgi:hypothetical protein
MKYYIDLAKVDIMAECSKFEPCERLRGIEAVKFYDIQFNQLAWLWDIADEKEMAIAIVEIFIWPKRNLLQRIRYRSIENFIMNCPMIEFYNFCGNIQSKVQQAAKDFSSMQIDLTDLERKAGYGKPDPAGVQKMIDTFSKRQRIPDHEDAGKRAWSIYLFVFRTDIEEANKQRKYQQLMAEEQKK